MIITCLNGYFIFREQGLGEVARFNSYYNQDLVNQDDYFTFSALVDAPKHSLIGQAYLGTLATVTFEASNPWDVMGENALVYDFTNKIVVPRISFTTIVDPVQRLSSYYLKGLVQPGSVNKAWQRISGYQCMIDINNSLVFNYNEFFYV